MQENSNDQVALFVRDRRTGRHAFNAQALKALGIDPAKARDRGYPLTNLEEISVRIGRLARPEPRMTFTAAKDLNVL